MRNKKIEIIFILFLFVACKQVKNDVLIVGNIKNNTTNSLFLQIADRKDTIPVDKNGHFEYHIKLQNPEFARIIVPQSNKSILLLLDTLEQVNLRFDALSPDSSSEIEGSKGSLLLKDIQKQYFTTLQKMKQINNQYLMEKEVATQVTFEAVRQKAIDSLKACIDEEILFLQTFIKNNSTSLATITALYQSFDDQTGRPLLLDVTNGMKLFEKVDSLLQIKYPQSLTVQSFHQAVIALKITESRNDYETNNRAEKPLLKIGNTAPDFKIQSIDNKSYTLSSLRGKIVLLDFWASWCPPCRALNPTLVACYNSFHSKGFEVFQVSLDKTIEPLQQAVKHDKLPWNIQTCDFKSWESPVAQLYLVNEIPQNFLIDRSGKIIGINYNERNLEKELKKIFN